MILMFHYHSRKTKMKSAQPFWGKTMAIVWGDPFTEEGTCPHCGYYKDKVCTNDAYCAIKETKLKKNRDKAKLLFSLYLTLK